MTIAFYGKSPRRRAALGGAAILAAMVAIVAAIWVQGFTSARADHADDPQCWIEDGELYFNWGDCAKITVEKVAPFDPSQSFNFQMYEYNSGDSVYFSLSDGQSHTHASQAWDYGLDYAISEEVPDGWQLVWVDCDGYSQDLLVQAQTFSRGGYVYVEDGDDVTCTFYNEPAGIRVTKVAEADPTADFPFTVSSQSGDWPDKQNTLSHNETWVVPDSSQAGEYRIHESIPSGWALDRVECVGDGFEVLGEDRTEGWVDVELFDVGVAGVDEFIELDYLWRGHVECTFYNTRVLGKGNLRILKWDDENGDGIWGPGEDPVADWPVTIKGPEFPGGTTIPTDASGEINLDGITEGDYTVTEGHQSGWYQTGLLLTVGGSPVATIVKDSVIATVQDELEVKDPDTIVKFGNRRLANVRVVKEVNDQVGNRGVSGWHINLAGCGTSINAFTDADGKAYFTNLLPADNCAYTVTETDTEGFSVSYSPGQVVAPGPGETDTVTVKNTRLPGPTETPAPPTPTRTATPTEEPEEPEPTETVAGEKTPGTGNLATPIAPDTGSGHIGGGSGGSIALAALGLLAVTAGTLFVSFGRKRA